MSGKDATRSQTRPVVQRTRVVSALGLGRSGLRPTDTRRHNRSLVLQTLYTTSGLSRADVARETGLTRVTVSDVVAQLIVDGLVVETGTRVPSLAGERARPGKPAMTLEISRDAFQIIGLDLSDHRIFKAAVLTIDGEIVESDELPIDGATGEEALDLVLTLAERMLAAATLPILGIGVGSPGIVSPTGVVEIAPKLQWRDVDLRGRLEQRFVVPVQVANDANVAALAEHGFGDAAGDILLIRVGNGVGAGLVLGGSLFLGGASAAGEIGHVVVGTDGGERCACGKRGCLETWLGIPALERSIAAPGADRDAVLAEAGVRLGIALAPVVGVLDLSEIVLAGPTMLDGVLATAAGDTIRSRAMADFHADVVLRHTALGDDIVLLGTAAMMISLLLGVA